MLVRWLVSSRRMSQRVPGLPNPVSLSFQNQWRRASIWSQHTTSNTLKIVGLLQQDKTELISLWVTHDLKEVGGLLMNDPESRGTDSGA